MRFFKILLWKAYFDKGWATTNYIKYIIALFGIASLNVKLTLIFGLLYAIFCLVLGRLWFKFKLVDAENEINNIVNPFQQDLRKKFGLPNKGKI